MPKSIHVSMPDFTVTAHEDGEQRLLITDCGFGRWDGDPDNVTPEYEGRLHPTKRDRDHHSSYSGAPMPWSLFFDEPYTAYAFHQGDTFGESHGCIHLSEADARWLFEWAGNDPVALTISGAHPRPGVRASTYFVDRVNMLPRVIRAINTAVAAGLGRAPDDRFDLATDAAVRAYQEAKGLDVDGRVGPDTAAAMGIRL